MKGIFKNSILVLIMLFSVNNVVLAKSSYISFGNKELNQKVLERTTGLVIGITKNAHKKEEQTDVSDAKYRLQLIAKKFSSKYVEEACKLVEDKNRQNLIEGGNSIKGICDQHLLNLLRFEEEVGIQVNHSPEVIKVIKRFNSLK